MESQKQFILKHQMRAFQGWLVKIPLSLFAFSRSVNQTIHLHHVTDLDNIAGPPGHGRGAGDESLRDVGGEAGGEGPVQLPGVGQGLAGDNHAVELQISQSDLAFWGNL